MLPLLLNCAILLQALTAFLMQMVERQQGIVTDVVGAGGVEGGMRLSCGGKRGETLGVVKFPKLARFLICPCSRIQRPLDHALALGIKAVFIHAVSKPEGKAVKGTALPHLRLEAGGGYRHHSKGMLGKKQLLRHQMLHHAPRLLLIARSHNHGPCAVYRLHKLALLCGGKFVIKPSGPLMIHPGADVFAERLALCLVFLSLAPKDHRPSVGIVIEGVHMRRGIDARLDAGRKILVSDGFVNPAFPKPLCVNVMIIKAAVLGLALPLKPCDLLCQRGKAGAQKRRVTVQAEKLIRQKDPKRRMGYDAVVIFFGVVPVTLTCFLQTGLWIGWQIVLTTSVAIGLLAANVLVVNNYRDMEDDASVGKRTTVVIFGRRAMSWAYLLSGILAMGIMYPLWEVLPFWALSVPAVYLALHVLTWMQIKRAEGVALNPLLGKTAINLLIFALMFLGICF